MTNHTVKTQDMDIREEQHNDMTELSEHIVTVFRAFQASYQTDDGSTLKAWETTMKAEDGRTYHVEVREVIDAQ